MKLKVIKVAKESNNCAATRTFDITEKMVRVWRKKEDVLREMPMKKCAMRGVTHWPELQDHTAKWVIKQRQNCNIVTTNMIRAYAQKWARSNPDHSWLLQPFYEQKKFGNPTKK